jgi:hypothetical protein
MFTLMVAIYDFTLKITGQKHIGIQNNCGVIVNQHAGKEPQFTAKDRARDQRNEVGG